MSGRKPKIPSLRQSHPCAAVFLDETGAIARDRIFAVGLVKIREPAELLRPLTKLRNRRNYHGELHYAQLKPRDLRLYKEVVDLALAPGALDFFCFIADRKLADPVARFGTTWDAYGRLAEQLVLAAVRPGELISVMADNYSTPDHVKFEQTLRANVNRRAGRLAVVSACRLDSRASDGLQLTDILIGGIAHEFRVSVGAAAATNAKGELSDYIRDKLGAPSCLAGWRSDDHSVQVYQHGGTET